MSRLWSTLIHVTPPKRLARWAMVASFVVLLLWAMRSSGMIRATEKDAPAGDRDSRTSKESQAPPPNLMKLRLEDLTPEQAAWSKADVFIMNGKSSDLEKMLDGDADLATLVTDQGGPTLLHQACEYDQPESVKVLLKHGADLSAKSGWNQETPLHIAARRDSVNAIKAILEAEGDIDILGGGPRPKGNNPFFVYRFTSPLDLAASAGSERAVELLLERGAKTNVNPPKSSYSALHRAMDGLYDLVGYGNRKRQFDPSLKAERGNRKVIELLLKHGCKLDDLDHNGDKPFHVAVRQGAVESVEYLLESHRESIDANEPGQFGSTPLQLSVQELGGVEDEKVRAMIELLLKFGADRRQLGGPSNPQTTAFQLASECKCSESILELLRP